jgi:hypothetical protein
LAKIGGLRLRLNPPYELLWMKLFPTLRDVERLE